MAKKILTKNGRMLSLNGHALTVDVSETPSGAVLYTEQPLTDEQKAQARTNIGAGTSSFSGSYNDLADKPSGSKTFRWKTVKHLTLAENTNSIVVSEDDNGVPIADLHSVGLALGLDIPADSTQESQNGAIWVYPTSTSSDASLRIIGNDSSWKNTGRFIVASFYGGNSSILAFFGGGSQSLAAWRVNGYSLDGVTAYINNQGDHFPAGTQVFVDMLCEVNE